MKEETQEFKTPTPDELGAENVMSLEELQKANIQEYVYPPDTTIEVTANLWNLMNQLANMAVNQEIPVQYEIPKELTPNDQQKSLLQLADEGIVKPIRPFASNLGIIADAVATFMSESHIRNIQTGVAIHIKDLQKNVEADNAKLDLGSSSKEEVAEKQEAPVLTATRGGKSQEVESTEE